jgi:hypothetical protein
MALLPSRGLNSIQMHLEDSKYVSDSYSCTKLMGIIGAQGSFRTTLSL